MKYRHKIEESKLNEIIRLVAKHRRQYDRDAYTLALHIEDSSSLVKTHVVGGLVSVLSDIVHMRMSERLPSDDLDTLLDIMSIEVIRGE